MKNQHLVYRLGVGVVLWAASASAQSSLLDDKKATEGATDVAAEGFQSAEAPQAESVRETVIKLTAGGFLATGNSKTLAVTGSGSVRIRRQMNQFIGELAANYGRAADSPDAGLRTTVKNFQGRIRYDRFLSERWALFVQESGRNDKFQGLDLRLNFDPGAAYYVIMQDAQHLSFELGYDLQYDIRSDEALATDATLAATEVRHAARLYGGYDNAINEHISFETGLEYLQAFANAENFRINWISALTSSFSDSFSLAAGFTLRYDNNPLPGVVDLDTITTLSLVYTMQ